LGKRTIQAGLGVTLEPLFPGAPVKIGSEGANQPLVLGNIIKSALSDLADIFTNNPPIGFGNLGAPVPLNPVIVAALEAWVAFYVTNIVTNVVSRNNFTEKGT